MNAEGKRTHRAGRWMGALIFAVGVVMLVGVFVLGTLSTKGIVGRESGNVLLAIGSVTWASALSLLATGWAVLHCRSDEAS